VIFWFGVGIAIDAGANPLIVFRRVASGAVVGYQIVRPPDRVREIASQGRKKSLVVGVMKADQKDRLYGAPVGISAIAGF
jgi:hypothetical protein